MARTFGICILLLLGLIACEKKKYPPILSSVSRPQAAIGEDITLSGTQFGDGSVQIGSVNVPTKSRTETSINLTVPRMATGPTTIRVNNADGTSDPLPFTVLQPLPQLTGIDPANGLPGTLVRISGDFLDKLKTVRFGTADAQVTPGGTDKQLTATVPTGLNRGPVKVTVDTEGGQNQADFIVAATPQITGFSPKRTIAGANLTITGKYLTDAVVQVNGVPVDKTKTTVQDDQINTIIPAGATSGRLMVSVFEKLTATTTDSLIIIPAPQIDATGLSITEGIEGDKLTIRGQNLLDVTAVTFGGTPGSSLKTLNNNTLEINVPRRSESGDVVVEVASPGGRSTATQKFLVMLAPTNISTETGRGVRGKDLVVNGRNLHRITGATMGGKPATITARTEGTALTLTVPADANTGKLVLTNRAGNGTSTASVVVVLKAVVTDFTRKAATGDRVVIKGDYLQNAWVFFAGTTVRAVNDGKSDENELWVKVPNNAGDGPLRVWNETDSYFETEVFSVVNSPSISTMTSEVGNLEGFAGEKITLTGQNFDDCVVRFLGSGQNAEWAETPTRTRLVVKIPADARTGPVTVRNMIYNTTGSTVSIIGKPDITDVSPNRINRGKTLTIKGSSLKRLDDLQIGRQSVSRTAWSENGDGTQVSVTVPDQNLRGQVAAFNRAGSDQHRGEAVVVVRPPTVTSVSSMREPIGAEISIKGDYLLGGTAYFGGTIATYYSKRNSDSELIVKIPDGANDGPIRVINDVGSVDIPGFTVVRAPVISDFNPKSGLRGSEVTITGQNLGNVTEVRFNNGGDNSTQINSRSDTQLKVRVSDQAQTNRICVYSPAGKDCTNGNYEVLLPPVISRINPDRGVSGTGITIEGQNFQNIQEVKFGSQTVNYRNNNSNSVQVDAPAYGSVQTVQVTVRTNAGTSNGSNFTGLPAPSIDKSRCIPAGLIPGSAITLKGSNFNSVSQVQFANTSVNSGDFIRTNGDEITVKVPAGTVAGDVRIVNQYATSSGIRFDLVTGGSGLNTGNISTNISALSSGYLSDNCSPELFGYCLNGSCMIYTTISQFAQSATCKDCKDANCRNSCKECDDRYRYKEEAFGGSKYHVFKQILYQSPQSSVLKFERTSDDRAYSGFVIFEKDGITYMGNVLSGNGSIALKSPTSGADLKLCKVLPIQGQSIGIFSNYNAICNSVRCDACN